MRKYIFICIAALVAFACQKPYKENWDLRIDSDSYKVAADSKKLPVTVYCSGNWTAKLVSGSDWASLDVTSGTGVKTIHLVYDANKGLSRKAEIELTSDGKQQLITVIQRAGVALPQIVFPTETLSYPSASYALEVPFDTNIPQEYLSQVMPEVSYPEDVQAWLGEVRILDTQEETPDKESMPDGVRRFLAVKVPANTTGVTRSANVKLSLMDAGGSEYSGEFTIVQSGDKLYITIQENDIVAKAGGERSIVLDTNLGDELSNVVVSVSYKDEASKDFLTDVQIKDGKLVYTALENTGTSRRYATISITYTDAEGNVVSASIAIEQKVQVLPREVSFSFVRGLYPDGGIYFDPDEDYEDYIECIVIGGALNPNMDHNLNYGTTVDGLDFARDGSNANAVFTTENDRTNYVESVDGAYGFRVKFADKESNTLAHGAKVKIFLSGVKIIKETAPLRYTITNLDRVETVASSVAIPVKNRTIASLTDQDVYTVCTLTDVEFAFKEGSFSNVREHNLIENPYTPSTFYSGTDYKAGAVAGNRRAMDGAPNLMYDKDGGVINMLVNMNCKWRRDGSGVPKGVGRVSGIIVHQVLDRWGGNIGKYAIRPYDRSDIDVPMDEASSFKTLAQWILAAQSVSVGKYQWINNTGAQGAYTVGTSSDKVQVQNKMIATSQDAAAGVPVLYNENRTPTSSGSDNSYPMAIVHGYRGLDASVNPAYNWSGIPPFLGASAFSSLVFYSAQNGYYEWNGDTWTGNTYGIAMEFSTSAMSGNEAFVQFAIAAGRHNTSESYISWTNTNSFPVYWKVQYATSNDNGSTWSSYTDATECTTGEKVFQMHSIPFAIAGSTVPCVGGTSATIYTQSDMGMGFVQHRFALPSSIMGKSLVRVRITPSSDVMACWNPGASGKWFLGQTYENKKISSAKNTCSIYLEDVTIQYK